MRPAARWLAAIVVAVAALYFVPEQRWRVPDRYDPWAPLHLDDAPGWLTRIKLKRLEARPADCLALVATTPWRFDAVPDQTSPDGCRIASAIRVRRMTMEVGTPFLLSCRAAVSLAMWERQVVQPESLRQFGGRVARLDHLGSYACRNIVGAREGRRSQHASANAIDIAGFVLANGRRLSVARQWSADSADGRFLRSIHDGACGYFDAVLGPDYNAAHADHWHLDRGPFSICR